MNKHISLSFTLIILSVLFSCKSDGTAPENNTNNDSPTFQEHVISSNFSRAIHATAGDMDNDGDTDILGAAFEGNMIALWENDGEQNFTPHILSGSFNGGRNVYPFDIDSDGDMDVLACAFYGNTIAWWENTKMAV